MTSEKLDSTRNEATNFFFFFYTRHRRIETQGHILNVLLERVMGKSKKNNKTHFRETKCVLFHTNDIDVGTLQVTGSSKLSNCTTKQVQRLWGQLRGTGWRNQWLSFWKRCNVFLLLSSCHIYTHIPIRFWHVYFIDMLCECLLSYVFVCIGFTIKLQK